ncbi:YafY family protein [Geobacter sp.]|uniref:helix-turn-helix transcriptional regulator n=1 Tax=Geobacter sp. TaxID=46610 RepID=UPI002635648E|nr:WYL domain-containing protein [Geobacter sp.]
MGDRLYFERFVWFDSQIRKGRYPNATALARKFEFDIKTAQRSIEHFRDRLGAPLEYDPSRRGYSYHDPDFQLPVTHLTENELVALLASRKLLTDAAAGPLGDELEKVSTRLGALLSENLAGKISPERAFSFRWNGMAASDPLIFKQTVSALLSCRLLTFCYYSPLAGACTARTVEPHHMVNYMGAWHLIAWCRLRNDWRDFHLARVSLAHLEDETFTPRHESAWRPLLDDTFDIFQNRERFEVTIRFSAERARWVRDELWHPDQRLTELETGEVELTVPVSHEAEILMEVLKHGSHAEVMEPDSLRVRIRGEIERMMKKY